MTAQLDLFVSTWPEGPFTWTGQAHWNPAWPVCDVDGSLTYWRCARDHGIDARCSDVYRLTHPVHRRDLPAVHAIPVQQAAVHPLVREVNRDLRGHGFLPSADVLAMIPALYATEHIPLADKAIHLHYFVGSCDWYVAELDTDEWRAFGYVYLGDPVNAEWGYVDLEELEAVRIGNPVFVVERDVGGRQLRSERFLDRPG